MYFNHVMPPGCKIVDFVPVHVRLMDHDPFQRALIQSLPDFEDRIQEQSRRGPCFTVLREGKPVVCAGVIPFFPGTAEAWMFRSSQIRRWQVALCKGARLFFDKVGPDYRLCRVQLTVNVENHTAVKWGKYLKFEIEGRMKLYGPTKQDHYMMSRIY